MTTKHDPERAFQKLQGASPLCHMSAPRLFSGAFITGKDAPIAAQQ